VVCFVIITVKCLLSESKGGTDGLGKLDVLTSGCQVFIDVVHGWNNSTDVGCVARKKKGAVLENLILRVD